MMNKLFKNHSILGTTRALKGAAEGVAPSTWSKDGTGSPGAWRKLNLCSIVVLKTKILHFANTSPMQRCLAKPNGK